MYSFYVAVSKCIDTYIFLMSLGEAEEGLSLKVDLQNGSASTRLRREECPKLGVV